MFESLKGIKELSDDQKNKLKKELTEELQKEIARKVGLTFCEIDRIVEDITGIKKNERQYTSKYVKESLTIFKDSFNKKELLTKN